MAGKKAEQTLIGAKRAKRVGQMGATALTDRLTDRFWLDKYV